MRFHAYDFAHAMLVTIVAKTAAVARNDADVTSTWPTKRPVRDQPPDPAAPKITTATKVPNHTFRNHSLGLVAHIQKLSSQSLISV